MPSLRDLSARFFGTADSLKLSAIAAGLNFLAWGLVMLGLAKDTLVGLAGFAMLVILVLTLGTGMVSLPLAVLDISRKPTRVQGIAGFALSSLVLGWNIFILSRWDL